MKSRGQSPLSMLMTTVVALLASLLLILIGIIFGSNAAFLEQNMARNIALASDAMAAAPGNAVYTVYGDSMPYTIVAQPRSVSVSMGAGQLPASLKNGGSFTATMVPGPASLLPSQLSKKHAVLIKSGTSMVLADNQTYETATV